MRYIRLTAVLLLLACGDGGTTPTSPPTPPTPAATSVLLSASDLILVLEGSESEKSIQLTATVKDQSDNVMTGQTVSWSSNDPNVATVSASGFVTGIARGKATVSASVSSVSATASVRVTNRISPEFVLLLSGHEQVDTVGKQLADPLFVRVVNEDSIRVPNQIVNFVVTAGEGRVFAGSALTDSLGEAREVWTLGPMADSVQSVEARAVNTQTGAPLVFATFTAIGVADVPATLPTIGDRILSGVAGDLAASAEGNDTLSVEAKDQYDNLVRSTPIEWRVVRGGGVADPLSGSATNDEGRATIRWQLGPDLREAQEIRAVATASDVESSSFFAIASLPQDAQLALVSGDAQVDSIGKALPDSLMVAVALADGQDVWGASVSWATVGD
ncbi:MAG TPA: hypothetical protein DCF71_12215, partial [Gemmatimonadetes bacterium]|nr:hypothetical protein [Gemmatimonadota bacterium]